MRTTSIPVRLTLSAFVVLSVLGGVACSASNSGARTPTGFVFTPVPYKYVPVTTATSIPFSGFSTQPCAPFVADEVLASVDASRIAEFDAWADGIGFSRTSEKVDPLGARYNVILRVPLGSVPAAVTAVQAAPGALDVGKNGVAWIGPDYQTAFCATFGPDP